LVIQGRLTFLTCNDGSVHTLTLCATRPNTAEFRLICLVDSTIAVLVDAVAVGVRLRVTRLAADLLAVHTCRRSCAGTLTALNRLEIFVDAVITIIIDTVAFVPDTRVNIDVLFVAINAPAFVSDAETIAIWIIAWDTGSTLGSAERHISSTAT